MSKTSYFATSFVYPAVAVLSLAAAFSAHAQQAAFDPFDQSGYGVTVVNTTSNRTRAEVRAEAIAARDASLAVVKDKAGQGATVFSLASVRTRDEVRAEAIAARAAGFDLQYLEGGDIAYAAMQRAKAVDTAHVVATAPAPSAAQ